MTDGQIINLIVILVCLILTITALFLLVLLSYIFIYFHDKFADDFPIKDEQLLHFGIVILPITPKHNGKIKVDLSNDVLNAKIINNYDCSLIKEGEKVVIVNIQSNVANIIPYDVNLSQIM